MGYSKNGKEKSLNPKIFPHTRIRFEALGYYEPQNSQ